jgi:flagellar biosynthesis protein FliP
MSWTKSDIKFWAVFILMLLSPTFLTVPFALIQSHILLPSEVAGEILIGLELITIFFIMLPLGVWLMVNS